MIDTIKEIVVEDVDHVRWIRISRAEKKNALTTAMYAAMARAIESGDGSESVAAVVITADGTTFTAGNDLADFMATPESTFDTPVFDFLIALARADVPIIAAVPGPAIGVGTTMLLHCDFVYATPSTRFHVPFVNLGIVPEAGSSLLLPRLIGQTRAAEMVLLGKPMDAAEALAAGIVTRIVEPSELAGVAADTAKVLAGKPRAALRKSKRLLRGDPAEMETRMRLEAKLLAEQLGSPEAQAAFAAFFKGR